MPDQGQTRTPIDTSPLFTPFRIRGVTLANRFVMPGMQQGWGGDNGAPTHVHADHYARRAEGGVSLVIGESSAIDHPSATLADWALWITEETLPGWSRCVDKVREAGGEMLLQLWHAGVMNAEAGEKYRPGEVLSPSGIVYGDRRHGRAATYEDLESLKAAYVRSALVAKMAGAAGVEIHACHGYLLDQFLWPETNRRDDGYGGDAIAARVRFPAEIVSEIRAACGEDFIISVRFSQWKQVDYDARVVLSPEELAVMLSALRDSGADLFHVSSRRFWTPEWDGSDLGLAGWTKSLSDVPEITVGSVGLDVDIMDNLLLAKEPRPRIEWSLRELLRRFANDEFDLVSVGRSTLGDPDWVQRVRDGRLEEIRPFRNEDARITPTDFEGTFVGEAHGRA